MHSYKIKNYLICLCLLLQISCSTVKEDSKDIVISIVPQTIKKEITEKQDNSKWTPKILADNSTHYLPDFSYAGYQWGEKEIPDVKGKIFNVIDYGAIADDKIDDTTSILAALDAAHQFKGPVVLFFPPGRFIISQILKIKRSNLVIRGSGGHSKTNTTLFFPKPILAAKNIPESMAQVKSSPIKNNNHDKSPAAWTGGFIWTINPNNKKKTITNVISGKQGKHHLKLGSTTKIAVGSVLNLRWCSSDCKDYNSLLRHAVNNTKVQIGSQTKKLSKRGLIRQFVTVEHITKDGIIIKEKLLHDIFPKWGVKLTETSYLAEVGIESLRLVFPKTKYKGHLKEAGYNALFLKNMLHGWSKDILIKNADNGIIVQQSKNLTIEQITLDGRGGHHTIVLSTSNDILVKNFYFLTNSRHGPSMGFASKLNVYTNGQISHSSFDQHNGLNEQNLFDNLHLSIYDVGKLFNHGGVRILMPTSAAFSTFWNIEVKFKGNRLVILKDAPSARLIGLYGSKPIRLDYEPNAYIEGLNHSNVNPHSLYQYQLKKRLSKLSRK